MVEHGFCLTTFPNPWTSLRLRLPHGISHRREVAERLGEQSFGRLDVSGCRLRGRPILHRAQKHIQRIDAPADVDCLVADLQRACDFAAIDSSK